MGRKLGNGLIIYGIVNFLGCLLLVSIPAGTYTALSVSAFIWMWILIFLGRWQRNKASKQEQIELEHQRELDLKEREVYAKERVSNDNLTDTINKVLDEREGKKGGAGIS